LSRKNKTARKNQPNSTHTTGSRSFAVVQDQTVIIQTNQFRLKFSAYHTEHNPCDLQEILEGKKIGRAELYRITHTNSKGLPVDDFAAGKIVSFTFKSLLPAHILVLATIPAMTLISL
jgi:hypothetical protein